MKKKKNPKFFKKSQPFWKQILPSCHALDFYDEAEDDEDDDED